VTDWERLHPLSPLVRSWKIVTLAAVVLLQQSGDRVARGEGLPNGLQRTITLGIFGGVVLVALAYSLLSWRMSSYSVDDEALHLRTGVLNRQQRQARLDRLQAVDVVQPLLARFIGLAELRIEVAGGKGSAVRLSYLRETDAQNLRRLLLARAAGLRVEQHDQAPEAPEQHVLSVPVPRLIESLARSLGSGAVLLAAAGLVTISVVLHSAAFALAVVPAMIGLVSVQWARFNNGFTFRVATSPDGLRLHHGLLQTTAQTVPPGRVQAVRLAQPLLWRSKDWWRVEVNVAGYSGGQPEGGQRGASDNLLLPVGTRQEALVVLSLVLPDLGVGADEPVLEVLDAGLTGNGEAGGFTASPRSARLLDPVSWRRHGYRVTERAFLARRGVFTRELDVVPHERTQSLRLEQGPLQRRLDLVSFVLHSTPGPVHPRVEHVVAEVGAQLMAEQAARAREARARALDERWMLARPSGPEAPGQQAGSVSNLSSRPESS
jgi:putative membrane protein